MKALQTLARVTLVLVLSLLVNQAKAQPYFDANGATTGSGVTTNGSYSWESAVWSTSPLGTAATINWVDGTFAIFAAGTDAVALDYTVTANANHTVAGMFLQSNGGGTVTVNGTGVLSIASGVQGFLVNGGSQNLVIYSSLGGDGGVENELSGSLYLYGNNSYSGGTVLGTSAGLNFNNNNSFGTGPISWGADPATFSTTVLATPDATAPITLANNVVPNEGTQVFAGVPAAPVVFSGAWTLPDAGTTTFYNLSGGTVVTISGAVSGSASFAKAGDGTLVLSGANTYTGGKRNRGGPLEIAGSPAGNVADFAGVLQLDGASVLSSNAIVTLASSLSNGAVNLNFSGVQTIGALFFDSTLAAPGTWGAPGSGASNPRSLFSGAGLLSFSGAPVITQQPQSLTEYPGANALFSVAVFSATSFTYQWQLDGANLPGATASSYTIANAQPPNAGTYTCAITNSHGFANTLGATLTILPTNSYVNAVLADSPIAYWRLGETNGATAHDGTANNYNGAYNHVDLGQPGYSITDPDACIGLSPSSGRACVEVDDYSPFFFAAYAPFSLEAWVNFASLTGVQRLFSTFSYTWPEFGYAFGIDGANELMFSTSTVQDAFQPLRRPLVVGLWYHLVCVSDGAAYHFYLNGQAVGTGVPIIGGGNSGVSVPLQLGCNPDPYPVPEQLNGSLDEVAIYNYALDTNQVMKHYAARYSTPMAPVVSAPVANPPTNYVSRTASIQAVAAGPALSYQWYKGASPLSGQTSDTLTLSPLQLGDADSYTVQVSNSAGTNTSPPVTLTVLPIPTNAAALNLTDGLVLHLPFDGDYRDVSGRGNNGTNVGNTTFVTGLVGAKALSYSSDAGAGSFNYVTLGVRPDLQFGADTDFSVSFWVQQPAGSNFLNLPFFTDAIGSTGNGGFAFAPNGGGGWARTISGLTVPNPRTTFNDASIFNNLDIINDGHWHHVVFTASRSANCTTYVDGLEVDSQSIVIAGNINTANPATIGQDPTGAFPVTAKAYLDDLGVWTRELTPLEVSGIYLAGASNGVSFASATVIPVPLQLRQVSGQWQISWAGGAGTLQASGVVAGGYTNVPNANSPYTIPTSSAPRLFYRLKF